ncbi:AmmeMemoRadiSam system radical SAM enzyme [Patescibacteria group bacterium]
MKEALVYQKLRDNKVRCLVCQRKCLISPGKKGFCQTKLNQKSLSANRRSKLYTLNYGLLNGPVQVDPIEKKPLYHFRPGTMVPSIGSWGCNFRCQQCLNHWCSWSKSSTQVLELASNQGPSLQARKDGPFVINQIKKAGYQGIAFTYNEPVVWAEYVLDVAKLAKKSDFFTVFVTNGSWTKETLDKIGPHIDAANIDLKGFSEKTYSQQNAFFGQIPQMAIYAQKKHQIFLEITTLLIPGINDRPRELKKMTQWITKNLGPKTPWHLSRFSPSASVTKEFQKLPATTIDQLKAAAKIGRKSGLEFIYIWAPGQDLPGGFYSQGDTVCPKCQEIVIKRFPWKPNLEKINQKGSCQNCQEKLNIKLG